MDHGGGYLVPIVCTLYGVLLLGFTVECIAAGFVPYIRGNVCDGIEDPVLATIVTVIVVIFVFCFHGSNNRMDY